LSNAPKDQEFKYEDEFVSGLLSVRESGTKAFVKLTSKVEPDLIKPERLEETICAWLESILSVDLIDDRALKEALLRVPTLDIPLERRISKGKLPLAGRDGKLILLVKPFTPTFEGEYRLWDKFQKRFDSITEGQIIARVYPPVIGTDGIDVYGKKIEAPLGKEISISCDDSLSTSQSSKGSFKELSSKKSGYLVSTTDSKQNHILKIETIYTIPSDIDHSTGSLDFIGGAVVRGSIMKGFQVLCNDEVQISGDVSDAKIESKNASIKIQGNIIGSEEAGASVTHLDYDDFKWIKARLDINAKSIEGQALFAGRNITLSSNAIRSILSSGSLISIKGAFYASRARTVCGIDIGSLGNASEVNTEIEFIPLEEAGEEFMALEAKIERLKSIQDSLSLFLGPYVSNPSELAKLSPIHKEKIKSSVKLLADTKSKIVSLENEKSNLKHSTKKNLISRLNVNKEVFPGVIVKREENIYRFTEYKRGPFTLAYLWDENKFELRPFEAIDCQWAEENVKNKKEQT
jgi:uncharacterized protein (DUF342 family)